LAEENYSKALALDPNNPDVLHSYSLMLAGVGRVKEALAMRQQLQTQEPFVPVFNGQTACLQWLNGQNDAAIATIKTLPPGAARSDIGRADLARMYVAAGRYSEAADLLLETSSGDYSLETMKEAARILRAAPATAASSENLPRFGGPLNYIYLHTGIPDRALEFYEGSVEAGYLVSAATDALWHSSYVAVRKTERFKAFVRKAGLVDYWRARGWPEFCHPTSADDFVCELPPLDSAPGLPRPDKPSIAVLAFQNMSGDPEQEFFADGIAEDIITTLSKSRGLFVIARNSSFSYKGKTVDIRQIGRELGVRYVLEGSVRKSGNRVRITAQLIDAADGHHVWAERYDRALEDIFAIQDEMTHNIIGAIAPEIVAAEIQRSLGKEVADLGQWERLMRAHWHIGRFTPEDSSEARRLLGELVRREPNNTLALSTLAQAWLLAGVFGWTKEPLSVAMGIGGQYARRAVAADDQDAAAHAVLASAEVFGEGRHDDGIRRFLRAIELDPNSSSARGFLGAAYAFGGECEPAIQRSQEALRLSPRDFLMVLWHIQIAWAYLSVENYEQTAENAKRAMECSPTFPDTHALNAVAAANLGRMADARAGIAEFSRLLPGLTLHDERLNRPFRRAEDRKRWLSGLKKAGLPE
ncbi:MAG TPA: hypothetical protein VEU95_07295, partial [Micropepsaceae bacterium]|nr:hypothetical protein [Micropepsaceae bacterium]